MKNKAVYISAALDCINQIKQYTSDYTLDTFLDDRKTQDAVIRNLEVIGQTIKDYGIDTLKAKIPQIPWAQVAGMRNILAHEYLGVDIVMVWDTVQLHLANLQTALEGCLVDD
ncbi:MAG: DUF86 domain-containing protein [Trichlorobacter sp.]|jgi:uncharacterized protein with HEPN domain|nr:DUF86 domain-containing protein [Trichlorobacter sp.]